MTSRLNIVPDPSFVDLQPALAERLERIAANIHAEEFAGLLDPLMRQVLEQGFAEAGAHEGTVWLLDGSRQHLEPAHNTGPRAHELVGKFNQPLGVGLISMVLASEQPFLENEVWKNQQQSKLLDARLQLQTCAMIAVPFYFMRACRGVVSCVQLQPAGADNPPPPGFDPGHLQSVQRAVTLLSRLIELHLLSRAIGWSSE